MPFPPVLSAPTDGRSHDIRWSGRQEQRVAPTITMAQPASTLGRWLETQPCRDVEQKRQ